ncbi:MAG: HEAT repeat domain-containing protein [Planctomycetes bacterium]|nr:HEAT repeat domain-containing protein [Planctomycetota bacterium]
MFTIRYPQLAIIFLVAVSSLSFPVTSVAEEEQPLIDVLQSNAPQQEKALTCKKLAIWGTARAVPALAALLPDPELTSWARIALEAIPDSAADEALREAMAELAGRPLIGVINSIGVRRDTLAVEGLIGHLKGSDSAVAAAAAVALGHIGNEKATTTLRRALADSPQEVRSAVAEGCILCAEKLLADGHADASAALYDEVRAAKVPKQRVVEATRGAILARAAKGIPLLVEQLKSSDHVMVSVGLMAARELSGPSVSKKLMAALGEVPAKQQTLLILAMADRGDAETVPAMLEVATRGPVALRIAALEVLKDLGNASCVTALLSVATEKDKHLAKAAVAALKAIPDEGVDADLVARLADAKNAERLALLELIGLRRIDAVPPLLAAVDDADAEVRSVALVALGEVAKLDNVAVLIARVLSPPHPEDSEVALKSLQAACVRMPDREACAKKLAKAMDKAPASAKDAILETLTAMGGANALQAVGAAANSKDAHLQDTATRLLGSWMTIDAGPVLLKLATASDGRYRVRALRGYLRLVRQFLMPDAQRAAMTRRAWEAAERDVERKLVLQIAQRYPSVDMLRLTIDAAKNPVLKKEATAAANSIAKKIGDQVDIKPLMKQLPQ